MTRRDPDAFTHARTVGIAEDDAVYDGPRVYRAPLTIRAGARPFEITVMGGGVLAGLFGLFDVEARSSAIEATFSGGWSTAWYWSLVFWCGLALLAVGPQVSEAARYGWSALTHPRGQVKLAVRLRVEQASMIGFSGSVFAYGISALTAVGASALTAATWIGLFGVAALIRAVEISLDLRKLEQAHAHPQPAYPIPLGDPRGLPTGDAGNLR